MISSSGVRLDTAENWKLKTKKHYSKIIFKCVNGLWVPWIVHGTHWCAEKGGKSQTLWLLFMNISRNSEVCLSNACKKKKKKLPDADALGFSGESKCNLDSRRSGQIPAIFSEKNCRIWRPFFFFFSRFGCFLYSNDQLGPINAHPHLKPTRPIFLTGRVHIGSKTNLTQLVDSPTIIYQHSLYST